MKKRPKISQRRARQYRKELLEVQEKHHRLINMYASDNIGPRVYGVTLADSGRDLCNLANRLGRVLVAKLSGNVLTIHAAAA